MTNVSGLIEIAIGVLRGPAFHLTENIRDLRPLTIRARPVHASQEIFECVSVQAMSQRLPNNV